MRFALPLVLALGATTAQAQSTIYGLDVRLGMFFTTDTADFVANKVDIGINTDPVFALDFDATGTTLWGINNTTAEYGTFSLLFGTFTPVGVITGPATGITGLTATVNGTTWYLMEYRAALGRSFLWQGDVTTGSFTEVGITSSGIMIDISIDSANNLYGHNITDDSLYSINTTTGAGMLIGPTGLPAAFAQGMDFDWSNNKLYASIYTGGGTGSFCEMNLATGAAIILEDTTVTNGEFEIAIPSAAGAIGFAYCFGDGSGTPCPCGNNSAPGAGQGCQNSTGQGGLLTAAGSASAAADDLVFTGANMQPGQPALLFMGLIATNGGAGAIFGDGLRCAGQGVIRLGIRIPDAGGTANWGPGLGAIGGWNAGDTRRFQDWYRNPGGSPCGLNFNLTNGYEITFN